MLYNIISSFFILFFSCNLFLCNTELQSAASSESVIVEIPLAKKRVDLMSYGLVLSGTCDYSLPGNHNSNIDLFRKLLKLTERDVIFREIFSDENLYDFVFYFDYHLSNMNIFEESVNLFEIFINFFSAYLLFDSLTAIIFDSTDHECTIEAILLQKIFYWLDTPETTPKNACTLEETLMNTSLDFTSLLTPLSRVSYPTDTTAYSWNLSEAINILYRICKKQLSFTFQFPIIFKNTKHKKTRLYFLKSYLCLENYAKLFKAYYECSPGCRYLSEHTAELQVHKTPSDPRLDAILMSNFVYFSSSLLNVRNDTP